MIKVNKLSFSYDSRKKILKDISFNVKENESLCVIGKNGSGKTTLLKCLCNILDFNGEIYINDDNIKDIDLYKTLSFMSQTAEIYFSFNVYDAVMLGRYASFKDKLLSQPSKEDKEFVLSCMEKLNIISLKDKPITELSGGELQKVFLARSFAQNPSVIIMDEPTNHLDINNQIELIDNLKEWLGVSSRCLITVSHDINALFNLADKILILEEGTTKYFGDCDNFDLQLLNEVYRVNVKEYMEKSFKKFIL